MGLSSSRSAADLGTPRRHGRLSIADGDQHHHTVQFDETDQFLVRDVTDFIIAGFDAGEPSLIIGTPQHRESINETLGAHGVDIEWSKQLGLLTELDARYTLSSIMPGDMPDEALFHRHVKSALESARRRRRSTTARAYDEMVNLLWREGKGSAALALASLWNRLAATKQFSLLCGYGMRQRAHALESEINRRETLEATLRTALQERERLLDAERAARAEAQEAQRQAEDANRAKSDFLAVMSHELRTPLNAIGGYAELMELGLQGELSEGQRNALERIQRSQQHLLGLINQVLNYTRLEAGTVPFELADHSLDPILRAADTLVYPQMLAKGLRYTCKGCDPSIVVRVDGEKLQQILLNLLTNATKFTDAGGEVSAEADRVGDFALVRVRDTGVGIPVDKLGAIFDPFVQVDSHVTRTREGVGLGLAISRDLARRMGGELAVESAVGVGSAFTLSLPVVQ